VTISRALSALKQVFKSSRSQTIKVALGVRGEQLAVPYLDQLGFQIVATNFMVPVGRNRNNAIVNAEIDVVAFEGSVLCFVEVKTRTSDWFAPPTANVDLRKQRQITRAAQAYRRMFELTEAPYRFDVVSIVMPPAGEASMEIELLRGFWTNSKFQKSRRLFNHWD
jgi:putative endonuclease